METIFFTMLGCLCGCAIWDRWFADGRDKLKYCIDITLKLPNEDIKDFIKRAHKERLGEYLIID